MQECHACCEEAHEEGRGRNDTLHSPLQTQREEAKSDPMRLMELGETEGAVDRKSREIGEDPRSEDDVSTEGNPLCHATWEPARSGPTRATTHDSELSNGKESFPPH